MRAVGPPFRGVAAHGAVDAGAATELTPPGAAAVMPPGAGRAGQAGGAGEAGRAGQAGWDRDEWDVTLSDGGAYRVFLDRATSRWFIDAILD